MQRVIARSVACGLFVVVTFAGAGAAQAQIGIGTWVKQGTTPGQPGLSMVVEACCGGSGRKLIYKAGETVVLTVESALDGTEAPEMSMGKPTGETMGIKRVDDHHTMTVLKLNGQQFGTSTATISDDGKTLTIENNITAPLGGRRVGKTTETWVRK
jgi:hypothetical protein